MSTTEELPLHLRGNWTPVQEERTMPTTVDQQRSNSNHNGAAPAATTKWGKT